jgi:hypothetical protein
MMVMTVELGESLSEDLHITVGDDPASMAADFVARHGLDPDEFLGPLEAEIRASLLDAYKLELADAVTARKDALAQAAAAQVCSLLSCRVVWSILPIPLLQAELARERRAADELQSHVARAANAKDSGTAAVAAATELRAEVSSLRERATAAEAARSDAAAAASAAAATVARLEAELAEERRRHSADVEALTLDLAAARKEVASARAAADEAVRRKATWERLVEGNPHAGVGGEGTPVVAPSPSGSAVSSASGVPLHATNDWRAWAAEKRELLARANADRALLSEENRRLRAALDSRGVEVEARLRLADEAASRAASDTHALAAARERAEAELRTVYRQWEADGARWAAERRRLTAQLDALLGATTTTSGSPSAAGGDVSALGATVTLADALAVRQAMGLGAAPLSASSSFSRGTPAAAAAAAATDPAAWSAQREDILRGLRTLQTALTNALPGNTGSIEAARAVAQQMSAQLATSNAS